MAGNGLKRGNSTEQKVNIVMMVRMMRVARKVRMVRRVMMVRMARMVNLVRMGVVATALTRGGERLMVDNTTKFS